ncbi:hypothetical protein [Enhygromyxa salina]|uniref:hypothetical protein n=1 Tax=Enhygromyxa salina TaxID=215803 RepID=UPI000697CF5C|nr:hypothetical protein [Enhygromyxa salina]
MILLSTATQQPVDNLELREIIEQFLRLKSPVHNCVEIVDFQSRGASLALARGRCVNVGAFRTPIFGKRGAAGAARLGLYSPVPGQGKR